MQNITFYARATETLGVFTDYANAKTKPAPILTRGVAVCLKMRLFMDEGSLDPLPLTAFSDVTAWQWVMDDDFDSTSNYILIAQHDQITVNQITAEIEGESRSITEFSIPIPNMNTAELEEVLKSSENIANLNAELVGYNANAEAVFILQLKGFSVRNRISSAGDPTVIEEEYYTATQTRALVAGTNAYELARNAEFNIGDRAYYPGAPGILLECTTAGTTADTLPDLSADAKEMTDGSVIWSVHDLAENGGSAAAITINGLAADSTNDIALTTEYVKTEYNTVNLRDILTAVVNYNLDGISGFFTLNPAAMPCWDPDEEGVPVSQCLSNNDIASAMKSLQYAVFSVNGKTPTTNDENSIDGAVTLNGADIYAAAEGTTAADWQGATLNTITVEQMAKDVYSCINSINMVPPNSDGTIVLTGSEIPINSDSWDYESGGINGLSVGDVLSYFVRSDESGYQYVSIDASYVFTSSGTAIEDMINMSDDRKMGVPSSRTHLSLGQGSLPSLEIPAPDGMTRTIYTPGWLYIFLDITTEQEVDLTFDLGNYSGRIRRTTPGTDTFVYPCKSGESYNILINYETTIPDGVTCVIEFMHGEMTNV